jgi:UDP-2-acetamido-3-amino-2,3-dideoxy-glucuronate N-acetyltransferase
LSTHEASVAVVGCGYWGKNLVRNFAELGRLKWICDANQARGQSQAKAYANVHATDEIEDILSDSSVNAVVIATPAALHYSHAKRALARGKDVFVEKPLALTYSEGKELVEMARARQAILMVGHIIEYHPAIEMLKEIVSSGELGRVWYIYSNRLNLGKVRREENILWSFAPHDISVIATLLDAEPVEVSATGGHFLQTGIVDVTVSNMRFDNGARAHIFVSWLHPYKEQKLVVIGSRKMAVFDDTVREGKLKIYDKGIEFRDGFHVPRQSAEPDWVPEIPPLEPLKLECEHFMNCVEERTQPRTGGESALRVLKVLQASQASLEQGGIPISLEEITLQAAV